MKLTGISVKFQWNLVLHWKPVEFQFQWNSTDFFSRVVTFPNVSLSTSELGRGWRRETGLSPPVKYFTDRSKAVLLLWIFSVFSVLYLLCLCVLLFICALWSPAWKGLTSWLSFVVSNCEFVTFPLVSWVRCGT